MGGFLVAHLQQNEATPTSGVIRVVLDHLPMRGGVDHVHYEEVVCDGLVIGVLRYVDSPDSHRLAHLAERVPLQASASSTSVAAYGT